MKIFGFNEGNTEPLLLNQATLEVSSDDLRKLSKFFSQCAEEIDDDPTGWDHEHFSDYLGVELSSDLVVYRKRK